MRQEIDRLREELTLVQVQSRNPEPTSRIGDRNTNSKDTIREEIESLRDEIKRNHTASLSSAVARGDAYLPVPLPTMPRRHHTSPYTVSTPPSHSAAFGRRSTDQHSSDVLSPRYSHATTDNDRAERRVGGSGYGGGDHSSYFDKELLTGHHHHNTVSTPPLQERSFTGLRSQSRPRERARGGGERTPSACNTVNSRYYF